MEKRYVCIWFPHLVTDVFSVRKPALKQIPFVVSAPAHGRMLVYASNALAEKNGVYAGMSLADARAFCPGLEKADHSLGIEEKLLRRIAEWCIRFTPAAAVDGIDGVVLDATGCTHLWGGDVSYVEDIVQRLHAKGFTARAAIADTRGAAWAAARFGSNHIIGVGEEVNALMPLPPEALRIDAETAARLHKLGLKQIKDVLGIPRTALRRRFGNELVVRLQQAFGNAPESFEPVSAAAEFAERLPCMDAIMRIEGIEIALQRTMEALCVRVRNAGKGIRTVSFTCYKTDHTITQVSVSMNTPTTNVQHLLKLFALKLAQLAPEPGIELFVLEATKAEEHSAAQEAIWKQSSGFHNKIFTELIDKLTIQFGAGAVHRYVPSEHYWPERSYAKAKTLLEEITTTWDTNKRRPILLLPMPERIEVTAPVPDYPPMMFRYKNKLHKIIKADGPERIEQEWWLQTGQHRDYYIVEDDAGCRYWLFRSGHYDAQRTWSWWIHGVFG
jgi:protein ImuB